MAITWADVTAIAPNLTVVPAAVQNAILAAVDRQVDGDAWGIYANDGMAYLAAHLASIRNGTGLVTTETLGAMSRSYSLPPGIRGSLALSAYGAEYQRLMELAIGFSGIVP